MKHDSEIEKLDKIFREIYSEQFAQQFKDKNSDFINEVSFDAGSLFIRFTKRPSMFLNTPLVYNVYELEEMLDKLCEDGNLKQHPRKPGKYILTFKGRLFLESKISYSSEHQISEEERLFSHNLMIQSEKNAKRLNWLTAILCILTSALAIPEGMKVYKENKENFYLYIISLFIITMIILFYNKKSKSEVE